MKNRMPSIIIIFFLVALSFLIGNLVQKAIITKATNEQNSITNYEIIKENENLKNQLITAQRDIDMLKKEIDNYQSNLSDFRPETSDNNIDISILDKKYMINGNLRDMSENQVTFQYKNDYYVPLSFITKELGITFEEDPDWIVIGNSILDEGFFPNKEKTLTKDSPPNQFEAILGKPISSETYINECTGSEETIYKYDGATLITGRSIEITKPVMKTMRGITIGATKEEVEKVYGTRSHYDSIDDHWIYGSYKASLWFEFENDRVIKFGILLIDC